MEFKIAQSSTTFIKRPPISSKVREYFEDFISDKLLSPKKLILNTRWRIELVICFVEEGPRYKTEKLFIAKGYRTVSSEKVKIYEVLVPLKILNQADDPYLRTIEIIYEAITLFFTTNYKSVTPEDMKMLWQKVDIDRLIHMPYPASLSDQQYVTDTLNSDGKVVDIIEWIRD